MGTGLEVDTGEALHDIKKTTIHPYLHSYVPPILQTESPPACITSVEKTSALIYSWQGASISKH